MNIRIDSATAGIESSQRRVADALPCDDPNPALADELPSLLSIWAGISWTSLLAIGSTLRIIF
ncbi:hypothetical protein, partial [Mesorhizobium sp. M1E.F.Ca.ET.041.01.1.1]|uniref:hypothetical protein n=1 Tax=Mesorhizobium sp. M1E.F.Ca.ET.041.01.1.1 TaxID=2496759 RepID=UPI001AECA5D5